jgi:hypothetical protein
MSFNPSKTNGAPTERKRLKKPRAINMWPLCGQSPTISANFRDTTPRTSRLLKKSASYPSKRRATSVFSVVVLFGGEFHRREHREH